MTKPLRAAIYARVSTFEKGQSPDSQIAALKTYCQARGWLITSELVDEGYSGGTSVRPALKTLMQQARSRTVDVVVVTKIDRLARSLKNLITTLEEFNAVGVLFVSTGDQIDMSTASGILMIHLLGAFGEFERALIRERTLAGLAYARSRGRKFGRPRTIDRHKAESLRAQGLSLSQIAKKLGSTKGGVSKALKKAPLQSAETIRPDGEA